jgi:RNA polymerase-binding transcription factor DksA
MTEVVMSNESHPQKKLCALCGKPIAPARLEALPGVTTCIECAKKHPRKVDTSMIELSQASPINRNGFAPSD